VRDVVISPNTPNCEIKTKPSGNPIAAVSRLSFMLNTVFPWPLMRFTVLRFPKAEYRYVIASNTRKRGVAL